MKLVIRILNFVIIGLSALATILLFSVPTFSFNSKISLEVNALSKLVPETSYTKDLEASELLGTEEIGFSIKFSLNAGEINKVMNGDREKINNKVIVKNLDDILKTVHEPVDIITEYAVKTALRSTIKDEITKQVDDIVAKLPEAGRPTSQGIMDEVGIDNTYFTDFTVALYDSANKDGATVTSVTNVLNEQVERAIVKVEDSSSITDSVTFSEEQKEAVKANMTNVLTQLDMIDEDSVHIKKLADLPYMYLTKLINEQLKDKVAAEELAQKTDESLSAYGDRLVKTYVLSQLPDLFYQIVGYISLALFICMFLFAGSWLFLLAFTVYRTFFSKKVYTRFFPWFYAIGGLQIALGFVLTGVCKYGIPKWVNFAEMGIPVRSLIMAPRTCALATSIVFIVTFALSIAYFVIRKLMPKED